MTQLQSLIHNLCDADHATVTNGWQREISNIICTCEELENAEEEERLDRWAQAVFTLFDPYDYQLYRAAVELAPVEVQP